MSQVTGKCFVRMFVACWGIALAASTHAAGFGGINVQSALGQPFAAEIAVIGLQPDDLLTAQTRIAGPEEYQAAKLAYPPLIRLLRIALEQTGTGKATLKITSVAPITEPALNILVEFSWSGGRLVQKYPILLDPPK